MDGTQNVEVFVIFLMYFRHKERNVFKYCLIVNRPDGGQTMSVSGLSALNSTLMNRGGQEKYRTTGPLVPENVLSSK
jgi:hypothetical protein